MRERDGIPDLRRGARYRYASVYLPEVGLHMTIISKDFNAIKCGS